MLALELRARLLLRPDQRAVELRAGLRDRHGRVVVEAVHGVLRGDGERGGAAEWAGLFGADEVEGQGSAAAAVSHVIVAKALGGYSGCFSSQIMHGGGDSFLQASFQPASSTPARTLLSKGTYY